MSARALLWRLLRFTPWLYAGSLLLQIARLGTLVLPGLVIQRIFDTLAGADAPSWRLWGLIALLVAVALARVAALLSAIFVELTGYFISAGLLRTNAFARLLARPDARALSVPAGDVVNRLDKDAGTLAAFVAQLNVQIGSAAAALVAVALMLRIDTFVTLVVLAPLLLTTVLAQLASRRLFAYNQASRTADGRVSAFLGEALGAAQALQVAGAEAHVVARLNNLNHERRRAALRDTLISYTLVYTLVNNIAQVGAGLVLLLVGRSMRAGTFSVGDFALFVFLLPRITDCTMWTGRLFASYRQSQVALGRLLAALPGEGAEALVAARPVREYLAGDDRRPTTDDRRTARDAKREIRAGSRESAVGSNEKPKLQKAGIRARQRPSAPSNLPTENRVKGYCNTPRRTENRELKAQNCQPAPLLEARGLSYRFPGTGRGIAAIDLAIAPGSFTVISGRVGAGKTTLLRALLGLLPADDGVVLWNGEPVEHPATFFVPPRAAYTAQAPRLFSESLRDNLRAGLPAGDADLARAAHRAVLDADLAALPHGLGTLVGPRGVRLSGGQVQRAAVARMLLRGAELLAIDDVSSALDVETEQVLWQRLDHRRQSTDHYALTDGVVPLPVVGRRSSVVTTLAVSHRPAALRRANQIILLEAGRVAARGTLAQLLTSSELMRALWQGAADHDQ